MPAAFHFKSEIGSAQTIVFFPGFLKRDRRGDAWIGEIRGWIFEAKADHRSRKMALRLLQKILGLRNDTLKADENGIFQERAGRFLADNKRGRRVLIRLGGRTFVSRRSAANGHFTIRIGLTHADAERLRTGAPAGATPIPFQAVRTDGSSRGFVGIAHWIEDEGVSVVSDIDDTIKISQVQDHAALLRNTFLKPLEAVDGMAELYQRWRREWGAQFHYLSASPWQLYPALAEFIHGNGFPSGIFHLRRFRWKDASLLAVLAPPGAHKRAEIRSLLRQFRQRRFVLVGDSGQRDPEIYAGLARQYPARIIRILIRDVGGKRESVRWNQRFKNVPSSRWRVFREPSEISQELSLALAGNA